jgi:hypothetical protein
VRTVPDGTPVFVASGKPHRCGDARQPLVCGVGVGVGVAVGVAVGLGVGVGVGIGVVRKAPVQTPDCEPTVQG